MRNLLFVSTGFKKLHINELMVLLESSEFRKNYFSGCFVHTLCLPREKDEMVVGAKENCLLSCVGVSLNAAVCLCGRIVVFSYQISQC